MSSSTSVSLAGPAAAITGRASAAAVARGAAVFALFTLVTVVIFWPWFAHPGAALIGPPEDNMQDFWNSWYAATGRDPGRFFFTTLLRFPEGTPLIYQSFAYPQIFAVAVLSKFFGSDLHMLVALQNFTLLASFPLAGLGAFYVVRHVAQSTGGGLIGGFIFAFSPFHVAQVMHHAHVSSIEFIPFFALAYLLAVERRSYGWLAAAVAFYALSALSCWYFLFYCAYFIAFDLLYRRMRDGAWPRGWNLRAPLICVTAVAALLSPLLVPMVSTVAPAIYGPGSNTFVADLLAFTAFPPEHLLGLLSRDLYARFTGNAWEATVYLGIVNLIVIAWLCTRLGLKRTSLALYVVFGLLFFAVLAAGEALHVGGAVTVLHLPDVALDKLPFFANVRTPSRAIVFAYLFLAIGVGLAAAIALRRRSAIACASVAVAAVLIIVDFYPAHLATTPVSCPAGLAVLAKDPERGFGVLNLPLGYQEDNFYLLEQACHGRPMVDGNTTREMATATLVYRLSQTDISRQRVQLTQAHVKYVLLHHLRPNPAIPVPPVAELRQTYRVVYDGRDMTVLRVY
jgi:hypothetical protein